MRVPLSANHKAIPVKDAFDYALRVGGKFISCHTTDIMAAVAALKRKELELLDGPLAPEGNLITSIVAEERENPSPEEYFYFGRTHEEAEILLLRQRRGTRREILAAA